MNKTKLLTIAVIALLILNFGILAKLLFFQERGPGQRPPHGGPKMIIIQKLNLDADQQAEYEALIHDHRSRIFGLNEEIMQLKDELYSLLITNDPDKEKVNRLITAIAEKQKETEQVNFGHFAAIRSLCRPEQLPAFNSLVKELTRLFDHKGPPPR